MESDSRCLGEFDDSTIEPLLSAVTTRGLPPTVQRAQVPQKRSIINFFKDAPRYCLQHKAVLMILMWNILVGATYGAFICAVYAISFINKPSPVNVTPLHLLLFGYGFIALIQLLFYPIGGLIADICCGRYRIVTLSVFKIVCGFGLLCILTILMETQKEKDKFYHKKNGPAKTDFEVFILGTALILLGAGFTGFQANSVQFGLDQMLDASSREFSLFLHWFVWTENLGQLFIRLLASAVPCDDDEMIRVLVYLPIPFFMVLGLLLALSCYKHQWFHSEPRTSNPYGTVYRVLKFVAKHDKQIGQRSAFTYADDEKPSRMEFAKQRYGGPFKTETVEDVKTFLRILIMLLAIGSIHGSFVSANQIFPFFSLHISQNCNPNENCNYGWFIFCSGNLTYLITVSLLPLYILFVHNRINKWMPKILIRLGLSVMIMFAAILSMAMIQLVAHHSLYNNRDGNETVLIPCLFTANFSEKNYSSMYNLHPAVLSIPNMLKGVASPLIYVTILEFISAQSPHTMKGLILGVFYAIRGFFMLMGLTVIFPFSIHHFWPDSAERSSFFTCGFSYYLLACILGGLGILFFLATAKWYRHRQREDRPYSYAYVENYYHRRALARAEVKSPSENREEQQNGLNASILDYGTVDGV